MKTSTVPVTIPMTVTMTVKASTGPVNAPAPAPTPAAAPPIVNVLPLSRLPLTARLLSAVHMRLAVHLR